MSTQYGTTLVLEIPILWYQVIIAIHQNTQNGVYTVHEYLYALSACAMMNYPPLRWVHNTSFLGTTDHDLYCTSSSGASRFKCLQAFFQCKTMRNQWLDIHCSRGYHRQGCRVTKGRK